MGENRITLDYNNMMFHRIGENGISEAELSEYEAQFISAAQAMKQKRAQMRWRELPYCQEEVVRDIQKTAREIREWCDAFVVFGIGGSALGTICIQQALNHLHYNELPQDQRKGPRLYVEDNIDPERMTALLDMLDLKKTCFNIITKSGGTSETMAQYLIIAQLLRDQNLPLKKHVIATTDAAKGNLIRIAEREGLKTFYVPDGVGGRFSGLCPVGLLPLAVAGVDIQGLLEGAAEMDARLSCDEYRQNIAYMDGALQYIGMKKGYPMSVMMPYCDGLKYFSDWYAQLWAESLGKRYDRDGKEVYVGQTPIKTLGVTDQHSQVQLYTEGPVDKIFTLIGVERYRNDRMIPGGYEDIPDVGFLSGHSMEELIQAEREATAYALTQAKRPNKTLLLSEINANTIGQLLYLYEVETAFVGELLRINAFDQPGVEEGKNATYAIFGKPGYDEKKAEMDRAEKPDPGYIL